MNGSGLIDVGSLFDGFVKRDGPTTFRIENGNVAAIGAPAEFAAQEPRLLTNLNATAMPGLIDTHVHLQLSGAEERQTVRDRFEDDRAAGRLDEVARNNAAAALAAGVTTVRDCGSTPGLLKLTQSIAGPRILATGPPITTPRGQLWWLGAIAMDEADVRATAAAVLDAGAHALKIMASGGFLTEESDPYRAQYSLAALRAAVEEAHGRGRRVVAHATAASATIAAAEAGIDSLDHAGWYAEDGSDGWTLAGGARVAGSGATIGLTAAGRLRRLLQVQDGNAAIAKQTIAHRRLAHLGVRIGVHSDAGGSQTSFDGFADSLLVAATALRRSPIEVLRMATSQAAEELGLEDSIGVLRPGRRADVLIVDGDPLSDLTVLRRIVMVLRDGNAVAKPMSKGASGA